MRLDLSFQDDAAEAEYRRTRLKKHAEAVEWMRVVAAACAVARLALLHASPGTIAAALLACLSKGAQLLLCGKGNLRLCYAAAVWCEVFIIAAGCVVVPHLGLGGGEGAPARSLIEWMLLAGHTWQLFTIACTPLPFRVLFPVLAAQSAALMVRAPHMCASPGLQHAYATLHRSLLRTARHIHLLPPVAGAAALAPQSAAQLCATVYQPAGVILGNACSGYLAFSAELSERRAFVRRHNGAGQRRLLSLLHTYGRLPVEPASYWLQFGLPSACALLALQLSMRA